MIKGRFIYCHQSLVILKNYSDEIHVNVGTGEDVEIRELASIIKEITGYKGNIVNDTTKPDGTPRKLLNVDLLHNAGWKHDVELKQGIETVYRWYLEQYKQETLEEINVK